MERVQFQQEQVSYDPFLKATGVLTRSSKMLNELKDLVQKGLFSEVCVSRLDSLALGLCRN